MKRAMLAASAALVAIATSVQAEPFGTVRRPFVETLSNSTSLTSPIFLSSVPITSVPLNFDARN